MRNISQKPFGNICEMHKNIRRWSLEMKCFLGPLYNIVITGRLMIFKISLLPVQNHILKAPNLFPKNHLSSQPVFFPNIKALADNPSESNANITVSTFWAGGSPAHILRIKLWTQPLTEIQAVMLRLTTSNSEPWQRTEIHSCSLWINEIYTVWSFYWQK